MTVLFDRPRPAMPDIHDDATRRQFLIGAASLAACAEREAEAPPDAGPGDGAFPESTSPVLRRRRQPGLTRVEPGVPAAGRRPQRQLHRPGEPGLAGAGLPLGAVHPLRPRADLGGDCRVLA